MFLRCMIAELRPISRNMSAKVATSETMLARPNSCGRSSRARIATCTNWTTIVEAIDTADHFAPEIAFSLNDMNFHRYHWDCVLTTHLLNANDKYTCSECKTLSPRGCNRGARARSSRQAADQ